jgi:hypothetical protein
LEETPHIEVWTGRISKFAQGDSTLPPIDQEEIRPHGIGDGYREGCERGDMHNCSSLGFLWEKGIGAPANRATALRYYFHACEGGEGQACDRIACLIFSDSSACDRLPPYNPAGFEYH